MTGWPGPPAVATAATRAIIPTLAADQLLVFLIQLGVLLAIALIFGRLAHRVGLPAVVGELCAGVLVGPTVLGQLAPRVFASFLPPRADQMHLLDAVGQLGMLLLVGIAGMHVDLRFIRRRSTSVLSVGAGALIVPLLLGVVLGFALPGQFVGSGADRPIFAAFLGVALSVSAIPVIAKTLLELDLMRHEVGQLIVGAAAIDDIIGWFLLSIVASAASATHLAAGPVLHGVLALLAVAVAAVVVVRPVMRRLLRHVVRSSEPGVVVATVTIALLLSAAATHALGLEPILGTFVTGVIIGSSGQLREEHHQPLRTYTMMVLAPVFFVTAGLRIDLTALVTPMAAAIAVLVVAVAMIGKTVGAYAGARLAKLGHWEGIALGAGLNARGIVEIVVATVGLNLGVLSGQMYTIIVLMAIVTSVVAPPTLRFASSRMPTVTATPISRTLTAKGHAK